MYNFMFMHKITFRRVRLSKRVNYKFQQECMAKRSNYKRYLCDRDTNYVDAATTQLYHVSTRVWLAWYINNANTLIWSRVLMSLMMTLRNLTGCETERTRDEGKGWSKWFLSRNEISFSSSSSCTSPSCNDDVKRVIF